MLDMITKLHKMKCCLALSTHMYDRPLIRILLCLT
jgi:hypothetical protein